jgi:hypothetical protein
MNSNDIQSHTPAAQVFISQATRGLQILEGLHQNWQTSERKSIADCITTLIKHDLEYGYQYKELHRLQAISTHLKQLSSIDKACLYWFFHFLRTDKVSATWMVDNTIPRAQGVLLLSPHLWAMEVGPEGLYHAWTASGTTGTQFLGDRERR